VGQKKNDCQNNRYIVPRYPHLVSEFKFVCRRY
jgi:hypothetical protein